MDQVVNNAGSLSSDPAASFLNNSRQLGLAVRHDWSSSLIGEPAGREAARKSVVTPPPSEIGSALLKGCVEVVSHAIAQVVPCTCIMVKQDMRFSGRSMLAAVTSASRPPPG